MIEFPSQEQLKKYADLSVKVGLNLQPGQRLVIHALRYGGVPVHNAPLIREIVRSAYQHGARFVDVMWRDDDLIRSRFKYAPRDSFDEFPGWQAKNILEFIENGDAVLGISNVDPDLLSGQDPEVVDLYQKTFLKHWKPISEHVRRNAVNWSLLSAPLPGWSQKVFPDLSPEESERELWKTLFEICRLDQDNPVEAWEKHIENLARRCDYLNEKAYAALRFTGPGTDLHLGLPGGHVWRSAGFASQLGIPFTANIPTEEVFTLPHLESVEGTVRASKPLNYGGSLIEGFSLKFKQGQVVDWSAEGGEQILKNMLQTDPGANRLGEVALVPHSSPISQSGLLFFNTLLDENASSHIALGSAYRFSLEGGETLAEEEFASRGGNASQIHVDFMIGGGEMDVDGLSAEGKTEPVMRGGEWAFSLE